MKKERRKREKRIQGTSKKMGNQENGITLVALVITVIIIIVLATVTINMAFGENGLIKQAETARDLTANSTEYETQATSNLIAYMNEILEGSGDNPIIPPEVELSKVEEIKGGEAFDTKTTIEDAEGNKIVVPAGFKIASDSGNTVQQGIVIEDVSASTDPAVQGSQFVWIPVGVFTKDGGTQSNEIILGRYTFDTINGIPTLRQAAYTEDNPLNFEEVIQIESEEYNFEEISTYREGVASVDEDGECATAYNLKNFIESVQLNGGYYIGRYEASYASGTSVNDYKAATKISTGSSTSSMSYSQGTLWNFISQLDASKVSINTYADSSSVKSDLINSYVWDTTLVFIQESGNQNYANKIVDRQELANTGNLLGDNDEVCKINDIAANLWEWTTESVSGTNVNKNTSTRGGYYEKAETNYPAFRSSTNPIYVHPYLRF